MEKWEDPIIAEVRQARERYAARFDFDVRAICRDLRKRQENSSRAVIRRLSKPAGAGSAPQQ